MDLRQGYPSSAESLIEVPQKSKWELSFESINTDRITTEMLDRIFEIEQDMWARWIWEYIQCNSCSKVFSKSDIYWKNWLIELPRKIQLETVQEIESIIWINELPCPCCSWNTTHKYWETYVNKILERYAHDNSFLSVLRNWNDEIVGFLDWYIWTLEEIFNNEFQDHFDEKLIDEICEKYKVHRDTQMLTFWWIGAIEKHKSLKVVLSLMKCFLKSIPKKFEKIPWIFESIINTSTYCTFILMWAQKMQINNSNGLLVSNSINPQYPTDILFHDHMPEQYRTSFSISNKDIVNFLRKS